MYLIIACIFVFLEIELYSTDYEDNLITTEINNNNQNATETNTISNIKEAHVSTVNLSSNDIYKTRHGRLIKAPKVFEYSKTSSNRKHNKELKQNNQNTQETNKIASINKELNNINQNAQETNKSSNTNEELNNINQNAQRKNKIGKKNSYFMEKISKMLGSNCIPKTKRGRLIKTPGRFTNIQMITQEDKLDHLICNSNDPTEENVCFNDEQTHTERKQRTITKTVEPTFKCGICHKRRFWSIRKLIHQFYRIHKMGTKKVFETIRDYKAGLQSQIKNAKETNIENPTVKTKPRKRSTRKFLCDVCSAICDSKRQLGRHKRRKHVDVQGLSSRSLTYTDMQFKCKACGVRCIDRLALESHFIIRHTRQTVVHQDAKFVCEFCGKCLDTQTLLTKHRKTHKHKCSRKIHMLSCTIIMWQAVDISTIIGSTHEHAQRSEKLHLFYL